ncbi:MAG TPA: hypothetical protein VIJ95_05210 [Hanamia sp.]
MKAYYFKFIVFVLVLITFSSCEQGYSYNYILTNNTDTTITVFIKTFSQDTTFTFLPRETKNIFSTFHGMEGFGGPFESEVKFDLDRIIIKKGKKISLKDYRKTESWKFIKKDKSIAEYKSIITNSEF